MKEEKLTGLGNIIIGKGAGINTTSASDCILIGKGAGKDITTEKRILVIKMGKQELRKKMTLKEYHFMRYLLLWFIWFFRILVKPFN
jgi:hypothetical protein